jgi:hypothetical protein
VAEVCDLLFVSDMVESPWVGQYHPAMATTPVFGIDLSSGATQAAAITQVCEPMRMVFTLCGKGILRFRRKAELLTAVKAFGLIDAGNWVIQTAFYNSVGYLLAMR